MNRNTAIILTVATAVLCGCPGLGTCLWGAYTAIASVAFGSASGAGSDLTVAIATGVGSICGGIILIAIPVAVGFFTLRNAPPQA